ncbi:carboxyltransferase domain-containing protein, partial [Blastococcus sp. CCUG 61487]|uniref:5-oxoprolinase subunit B family protein n=1 Tax=Blastococcus sp. CCUG 61487 TaxID=1840703 RepID=UPI0010C14F01
PEATPDPVVLPVVFDGPDLAEVARLVGLAVPELVRALTAAELTVAFGGFAPGFGYLTGLLPELHVPRRATPRTRVPAGAVALAGEFAGVYPRASPGGWQLVGRTDAVLFDVQREPPALLRPGVPVRFREVS